MKSQEPRSRKFQLFRGEDSPVFCWHLIPQRLGDVSIIVNVYQVDGWLGSAPVHTTAVQQFAGEVRVTVHAVDLPSEKRASLERRLAEYRENLRIIEEQKSLFVEASSIPLQIIKEEQGVRKRIAELESQLGPQP